MTLYLACEAYESLPLNERRPILDNIVFLGLEEVKHSILQNKEFKKLWTLTKF